MRRTPSSKRREGREAFELGYSVDYNPYKGTRFGDDWEEGYREAELQAESDKTWQKTEDENWRLFSVLCPWYAEEICKATVQPCTSANCAIRYFREN